MSFGGAIDAMIRSYTSNRGLLKKRKRLREIQDNLGKNHTPQKKPEYKKADPEELKKFHDRLIREKRILQLKRIAVTLIISTVFLCLFYFLLFVMPA